MLFLNSTFLRYLIVGLLNTIFGYGVFAIFIYLGLHYSLALFIATILGVLFNFKSIGSLVFKTHNNKLIFRFVAVYVVVYILNVLGLKILFSLAIDTYLAGAILLLPMAIIAFVLNKRFVFQS